MLIAAGCLKLHPAVQGTQCLSTLTSSTGQLKTCLSEPQQRDCATQQRALSAPPTARPCCPAQLAAPGTSPADKHASPLPALPAPATLPCSPDAAAAAAAAAAAGASSAACSPATPAHIEALPAAAVAQASPTHHQQLSAAAQFPAQPQTAAAAPSSPPAAAPEAAASAATTISPAAAAIAAAESAASSMGRRLSGSLLLPQLLSLAASLNVAVGAGDLGRVYCVLTLLQSMPVTGQLLFASQVARPVKQVLKQQQQWRAQCSQQHQQQGQAVLGSTHPLHQGQQQQGGQHTTQQQQQQQAQEQQGQQAALASLLEEVVGLAQLLLTRWRLLLAAEVSVSDETKKAKARQMVRAQQRHKGQVHQACVPKEACVPNSVAAAAADGDQQAQQQQAQQHQQSQPQSGQQGQPQSGHQVQQVTPRKSSSSGQQRNSSGATKPAVAEQQRSSSGVKAGTGQRKRSYGGWLLEQHFQQLREQQQQQREQAGVDAATTHPATPHPQPKKKHKPTSLPQPTAVVKHHHQQQQQVQLGGAGMAVDAVVARTTTAGMGLMKAAPPGRTAPGPLHVQQTMARASAAAAAEAVGCPLGSAGGLSSMGRSSSGFMGLRSSNSNCMDLGGCEAGDAGPLGGRGAGGELVGLDLSLMEVLPSVDAVAAASGVEPAAFGAVPAAGAAAAGAARAAGAAAGGAAGGAAAAVGVGGADVTMCDGEDPSGLLVEEPRSLLQSGLQEAAGLLLVGHVREV